MVTHRASLVQAEPRRATASQSDEHQVAVTAVIAWSELDGSNQPEVDFKDFGAALPHLQRSMAAITSRSQPPSRHQDPINVADSMTGFSGNVGLAYLLHAIDKRQFNRLAVS